MKLTLNIEPKPQSRPRFTRQGRAYDDLEMKAWRNHLDKKPDIDNYEKALYDSMSGIVFKDDGQIALHDVGKFYSLNPRIEVEIEEIRWNG